MQINQKIADADRIAVIDLPIGRLELLNKIPDLELSLLNVAGGMKKRLAGCLCRVAASFFLDFLLLFHQGKSKTKNYFPNF